MVAVQLDGLERPGSALHLQPVGAAGDGGTHRLSRFDKADVTLYGVRAQTLDFDAILTFRARGYCAKRYEIASAGGVSLDVDGSGRAQRSARRDGESLPALALHLHAKARQHVERDLYVGAGDELAHHLDDDGPRRNQGQRHQQSCEELARHVATHPDGRIQLQCGFADFERGESIIAEVIDAAAELSQRIHQVADRPLVHPGNAAELKVATHHGQRSRERAHGGAGVAQEKLG